jgi:hypothetical protein
MNKKVGTASQPNNPNAIRKFPAAPPGTGTPDSAGAEVAKKTEWFRTTNKIAIPRNGGNWRIIWFLGI